MLLMKGQNLKKSYGDRVIVALEEFSLYGGDRIGIVGLNGEGKSTFLKLLTGEIMCDEGVIERYGDVAYIPQLEPAISQEPETHEESFVKSSFLDIREKERTRLSGGEETRLKIDQAMQRNASILLADEPTSHLDLEGIKQLEKALNHYKGAVVLISHDRAVLNNVCGKILEIEDGKVTVYKGNYDDYEKAKKIKKETQLFEYEAYQKEKQRLLQAATDKKEQSDNMKKAPSRMGPSEARLHKGSTRQKKGKVSEQSKTLLKRLSLLEEKEKPKEQSEVQFDLEYFTSLHAKYAVRGEHLDKYFNNRKLFKDFSFMLPTGSKCALLGENGTGKTTLLNMIKEDSAEGMILPEQAKIGYFTQDLSYLNMNDTILESIKESSPYPERFIRTICARLLFKGDAVFKKIESLSGGERAKVALAKVFLGDFNILMLDEPTNYLDIFTQGQLIEILKAYPGTLLFVSHDRHFIHSLADQIIIFQKEKEPVYHNGSYQEFIDKKAVPAASIESHNEKMLIEIELTSVLSQLSMDPEDAVKEQLEKRFQQLVKLKNRL